MFLICIEETSDNLNGSEAISSLTKNISDCTFIWNWISGIFYIFYREVRVSQNDIILTLFLKYDCILDKTENKIH